MEQLYAILEEIIPEAEFKSCTNLVTDGYIDSFDIVTIIDRLEEEFDVDIPVESMVPENFESVEAMYKLIASMKGEGA